MNFEKILKKCRAVSLVISLSGFLENLSILCTVCLTVWVFILLLLLRQSAWYCLDILTSVQMTKLWIWLLNRLSNLGMVVIEVPRSLLSQIWNFWVVKFCYFWYFSEKWLLGMFQKVFGSFASLLHSIATSLHATYLDLTTTPHYILRGLSHK